MFPRRNLLFASALLLAQGALLQSQTQSRVTGAVTDISGAVIAGANIEVRNTDTGIVFKAATTPKGAYLFPALPPGKYDLRCEAAGFRPVHRPNVVLETGYTRTVDVRMEIGAITESVEVKAETPLLEAANSTIGQLIERASVMNMPLESRRSASLIKLMGAIVFAGEDSGAEQIPRFSMAGGRGLSQMWYLDGGVAQNQALGNQQLGLNPPSESLQEFKADINNYSAEFGRSGSGVIVMTTRSGTNQFHGAAYEFLRNDKLDSRTFFARTKPPLRSNIFGASIGGPIRRNRTFFFFNYEGSRRRTPQVFSSTIVPHAAEVNGDFSSRKDLSVIDPLTKQPFPGNIIPQTRIDPIGRAYAKLYPAPNVAGNDITRTPLNNYYSIGSDKLSQNFITARADHSFSSNDRITGRLMDARAPENTSAVFPDRTIDSRALDSENKHTNWIVTYLHNFRPTLLNEIRYNWGNRYGRPKAPGVGSGLNGKFGIKGVDPDYLATVGITGLNQIGASTQFREQSPLLTQYFVDQLTWVKGKHQFKAGGEYRNTKIGQTNHNLAGGRFDFTDRATGNGLATLLLGWTSTASFLDRPKFYSRMDYYGGFVQDDWKISSRFTFNLGLRWEVNTPPWIIDNTGSWFDGTIKNPVSGNLGALAFAGKEGVSRYPHDLDLNNFGPRVGFAWRATNTVVIRSGYGLAYNSPYWAGGAVPTNGFDRSADFASPDGGFTPAFLFKDGMPPIPEPSPSAGFGSVTIGSAPKISPGFYQRNQPTGYAQQWNLTIQKELHGNMLMEGAYLANIGKKLAGSPISINMAPLVNGAGPARQDQRSRPYPQYNTITWNSPAWGSSSYHAMNLKMEKRYSNGLSFLSNYTFSKFLDNVNGLTDLASGGVYYTHIERHNLDKSLAGNNIRHRLMTSALFDLPFGEGRRFKIGNRLFNAIAGGWGIGTLAEFRTGFPWGTAEQTDRTNTYGGGNRPILLRDPSRDFSSRGDMINQFFDTSAFSQPDVGQFGNAARFVGVGPGAINVDASLHKRWKVTERFGLLVRGDFLNAPNHPNFAGPNGVRGRGDFGRITSLLSGTTGRMIQLSMRLEF